ncbi:hypothetical protein [Arcticibacter sp. MXS-1]|uniref:hypothetical protein n=1 Tax=Arcticibacter sp. MXS-1 TaxID=3341726 RepID=UPI0035A92CBE
MENDYHFDQTHGYIIQSSGILTKLPAARRKNLVAVDVDNAQGAYSTEWHEMIVASNNNNEIYTLPFNIAYVASDPLGFRVIFQTARNANTNPGTNASLNYITTSPPKVSVKSSVTGTQATPAPVIPTPITIEMNY